MKILTVIGARPQFIKAAMVSRAIINHNTENQSQKIVEEIIHTGQHFDHNMSQLFFDEMGIPEPVANLQINSGLHGEMTGQMLESLEKEIIKRKPDWLLVYGDTNSTLAAALAASKLHVPIAHVEAGLRSFNKKMPEEINRILTDHVSSLLFCPTKAAMGNLMTEGLLNKASKAFHTGDVMYDAAIVFGKIADKKSTILHTCNLNNKQYYLTTVHRAENTDNPERLKGILEGLTQLAKEKPVVFPVHPRTRKIIQQSFPDQLDKQNNNNIMFIEPVSFLDMVRLEQGAKVILTDSGGVQKEAYFHNVPCVTLRDETEWIETIEHGWNQIVGTKPENIISAVKKAAKGKPIKDYGSGKCASIMLSYLLNN
jgi:UDP-GlcNAc3NAcA epimerase